MAIGTYRFDALGVPKKSEAYELIEQIRQNIEDAWEHDRDNRIDQASDIRFCAGDQWPEVTRNEREDENRPMATVNRLPQFIRQVTNPIRQADVAIKVKPVDDGADRDLTDVYNGLLRQIHYRSRGKHIIGTWAEHQATGGLGWMRIDTGYADDSAFDQEITFSNVRNPLSVYCDPAAIEPDRSDAMWIAVAELMPRSWFQRTYPNAKEVAMDVPAIEETESRLFWTTSDGIRIAEYWWKEPIKIELALMEDGSTIDVTDMSPVERLYLPIIRQRTADSFKVRMALVSGSEILEGPFDWPGKFIPLVAAVGGEFPLEDRNYRYGVVRFAKDPQQLYNYARTAQSESYDLQAKAPWLVQQKQIARYISIWNSAGRSNRPYLPFDADPKMPNERPQRIEPPALSSALANETVTASDDLKATTGIYDAALGARSNETSGRAIIARDQQGDTANYHFQDNLERSLEHAGRIIVDLIPHIYDNERVLRLMGEDGKTEERVEINKVLYAEDGMPVMFNDLSRGRFDIRIEIGKSFSTKRMETSESMMAFVSAFPPAAEIAGDLIAKAMDWPGADELAGRLRKLVALQFPGVIEPEPGEEPLPGDPAQEGPSELEQAGMDLEMRERESKIEKTMAEARKIHTEVDRMEVEDAFEEESGFASRQQKMFPQPAPSGAGGRAVQ
ncbi:MAG: hypothetical protein GDA50_04180 [Alphaproteobacteria bacterium GM202ARS2]|nr:hypothetical protein [Alphaproteobacteria bacterium GM202ARS2]